METLDVKSGMVLYLSEDNQSGYPEIERGKLRHMVVVLKVFRSGCVIVCIITSKLPTQSWLHQKYILIRTNSDSNPLPGNFGTLYSNLKTIDMITSGTPFRTISYINLEPFLVHRDNLKALRLGQAKVKRSDLLCIRNDLVEGLVPGYLETFSQMARIIGRMRARVKPASMKSTSLKPASPNPACRHTSSSSKFLAKKSSESWGSYPDDVEPRYESLASKNLTTSSPEPYGYSPKKTFLPTSNLHSRNPDQPTFVSSRSNSVWGSHEEHINSSRYLSGSTYMYLNTLFSSSSSANYSSITTTSKFRSRKPKYSIGLWLCRLAIFGPVVLYFIDKALCILLLKFVGMILMVALRLCMWLIRVLMYSAWSFVGMVFMVAFQLSVWLMSLMGVLSLSSWACIFLGLYLAIGIVSVLV